MKNLLEEIKAHKIKEVEERKSLFPVELLERSVFYRAPVVSMVRYLRRPGASGIIAEFKRRSPSKGALNLHAPVERTSIGYMMAGASALSILTDQKYFGGSSEDLSVARKFNYCPILRKDFILDPYQVIESRSIGADIILLIAALLNPDEVRSLAGKAKTLGMEVLLEVHRKEELDRICDAVDIVGVNNRDLDTLEISLDVSEQLAPYLPKDKVRISESGISSPEDILRLRRAGYSGFLMGENFMKHGRPERACEFFIRSLKTLQPA